MDAFKKVLGGDKQNAGNANANAAVASGQKADYGDKGAEYVNKKYFGDKANHNQLEKITDSAREGFEKLSGKKVPEKFSN
ncbi:hypothetical protein GGS24DRAFT_479856 [Hypoxylon argillaceum]|nr:hypothetical protein GGS24DRAFT_479856 [Hypoxylon argillaceum]